MFDLIEIRRLIQAGRLTPLQAAENSLVEARRLQPVLNVFTEICDARARSIGRRLDQLAPEHQKLLHGVPVAFKDMFDQPDRVCTFGSKLPSLQRPDRPAALLQHLEDAGAITIGFLNMSEFALGPTGHNATFGHCRNPWDPERVSGGSSSGAASAIAAGIVAGTIGSDTGGSIRIPASCCGVVGLKTTQGSLSSFGALPLSPSLDCFGPLAASVEGCAQLYRACLGESQAAPTANFPDAAPVRLAYPAQDVRSRTDREVVGAVEATLSRMEAAGVGICSAELPAIEELHGLAGTIQGFESLQEHSARLSNNRELYTPHVLQRIERASPVPRSAYQQAVDRRAAEQRRFMSLSLAGADAMVVPTLALSVPTIDEMDEEARGPMPDLVFAMTRWTRWVNYLGLPAISIPCGFDRNGMPIGLQLIGPAHSEHRLLGVAKLVENAADGSGREPAVSARSIIHPA